MSRQAWTEALAKGNIKKANVQQPSSSFEFHIGIDCGKNTGLAVWSRDKKEFLILETTDFWTVFNKCKAYSPKKTRVIVEVPKTKAQFGGNVNHIHSVAIGSVIRESKLMSEGLKREGYTVIEQHPQGKVSADEFKRITGYQGRTNEHNRDAGLLVYGS